MKFVALGSTEEIGASCLFLHIDGTGLMLDAGLDPEEEGADSLPRYDIVHQHPDWYVDHIMISHAHHDHLGGLPVVIRQFPHVNVHMTEATRKLAEMLLPASARLQRRKLREGSSTAEPLFAEDELDLFSYLYLTHDLETDFDITGIKGRTPITARFYPAGHILGSAGVLIRYTRDDGQEHRLFYTSDTSVRPQTILPAGDYPEGPIDTMILESTLGADPDAELTTRRQEEKQFGEALQRVIERGGTVLIPAFALGRAQEVLALLDRFKRRGLIPEDTPIYTAGSMRAVADVYDKTRLTTPRLDEEFTVFGVSQKRLPRSPQAVQNALNQPSIHLLSSGMMFERTISNKIAQQLIEHEKNAVLFVGFAREDSPAARLLEAAEQGPGTNVVLNSERGPQPVHCEVGRFRFSGHSHRRDLIQLVEQLQPRRVVLVHGETKARAWMADNIRYFYPHIEVVRPELGQAIDL